MALEKTIPGMLYGFYGSTSSKQPFLSAAYDAADAKGELSLKKKGYYLVDLTYRAPASFTHTESLYGQFPAELLHETPFIVARRLSSEAALDLGRIWQDCVKRKHGLRRATSGKVDWSSAMNYMLAFPDVVDLVFEELPNVQCILMPMKTRLLPDAACIVGVAPKANPDLAEAEVRLKPSIQVDLSFA